MVNTSKMGDLDINLITLYARTPALYDKRNPLYRDKVYAERAWGDIAEKLGYKVEILRDRMLQLRNRYNLEKRKLESMKSDTCPSPKSSWVLFKYLLFFDGHIKQRRSYKMLRKIENGGAPRRTSRKEQSLPSSSNDSFFHNDISMISMMRERENEIKSEHDDDDSNDVSLVEAIPILKEDSNDSQIYDFNGSKVGNSTNFHSQMSDNNSSGGPPPMTVIPQHPYAATATSTSSPFDSYANIDKKFNKYNAFGQFIAAFLADLPDDKATDVMQRITLDIFTAQRDMN